MARIFHVYGAYTVRCIWRVYGTYISRIWRVYGKKNRLRRPLRAHRIHSEMQTKRQIVYSIFARNGLHNEKTPPWPPWRYYRIPIGFIAKCKRNGKQFIPYLPETDYITEKRRLGRLVDIIEFIYDFFVVKIKNKFLFRIHRGQPVDLTYFLQLPSNTVTYHSRFTEGKRQETVSR